ncbi:hypothetical protein [Sphingomonas quercus]|nr:hypothetical protein [Sphingomonas quercus]
MRMRHLTVILFGGLALAACGKSHDTAEALDNAAAQSDPAAAAALNDQAEAIRNDGATGDLSAPNSTAQNALQAAGNAAVENSVR